MLQQTKERKVTVGITHGDFNGISYEVIIKALNDNRMLDMFTPVIYGLSKVLSFNRKNLNYNDFNYKVVRDASQAYNQKINIVNLSNEEVRIDYGKSVPLAGEFAFKALERAVKDIGDDQIQVVVTAPLNKENIQSDQFRFPGHTEYLTAQFKDKESLMVMIKSDLRIAVLTGHIPLNDVAAAITEERLMAKLLVLEQSLKRDFLIERPKIAVLGLNPHAGERGLLGNEEDKVIHPGIVKAKKNGTLVFGPFPADGFFGSGKFSKFDAVLAMYHDQGLTPFKALCMDEGINFTAGLPVVRTSPAHGTAFELAGKNLASTSSFRNAIYQAINIVRNRELYSEISSNPLPAGGIPSGGIDESPEDIEDTSGGE